MKSSPVAPISYYSKHDKIDFFYSSLDSGSELSTPI